MIIVSCVFVIEISHQIPLFTVSSMTWKTNVGTGRYNTILIGILIFLNLAVVALVIAELATTAPGNL